MKTKLIIATVALAAALSSCSTFKYQYSESRIAEANTSVFVIPPTAKVSVNPESFVDVWVFDGRELRSIVTPGINAETITQRLKTAASNKSLVKHNGDILVAPVFDIVSENDGHSYTVTVRGYTGTFTDWNKNTGDYIEIQKNRLSIAPAAVCE